MISILLTVLKIIGIAILIILGLIFLILLLALFVPVRYNGKGCYHDGSFAARLRASWLLHIISASGTYELGQSFHIRLRLFGIAVYDNQKEKTSRKNKNKKVKSTKNKTESAGEIQAASEEEPLSEDVVLEDAAFETHPGEASHEDFRPQTKNAVNDSIQDELTNSDSKGLR
ncbi:MAG: hypothetical protein K2K74_03165, partial [Lachnospiraceae bacterium]|nr:hypothetical protein [Lachnospiraceae bacterium]